VASNRTPLHNLLQRETQDSKAGKKTEGSGEHFRERDREAGAKKSNSAGETDWAEQIAASLLRGKVMLSRCKAIFAMVVELNIKGRVRLQTCGTTDEAMTPAGLRGNDQIEVRCTGGGKNIYGEDRRYAGHGVACARTAKERISADGSGKLNAEAKKSVPIKRKRINLPGQEPGARFPKKP